MTRIHATAIVAPEAELADGVEVGPYCVIGPGVRVGENSRLMSHVALDGRTTLGAGCSVFPFASIGTQTQDLKYRGAVTFVEIGDGTTLREYVTVNSGTNEGEVTRVGAGCLLMAGSHVAHACTVGDRVILANAVALAGEVVVEDQAIIGGLSAVHQFVRIGQLCMVGGCTRITQDCPPFMTVVGNPAEVHGLNTVGLERSGVPEPARRVLREAYRILYRRDLSTRQAIEAIRAELEPCGELDTLVRFVEQSKRGIVK
jgi:UDP-N-acetylglucosamine acyltransferase